MGLDDLTYASGRLQYRSRRSTEPSTAFEAYLGQAREIIDGAASRCGELSAEPPELSEDFQSLRWFPLPAEALRELREQAGPGD
jgi:hypothetical protein